MGVLSIPNRSCKNNEQVLYWQSPESEAQYATKSWGSTQTFANSDEEQNLLLQLPARASWPNLKDSLKLEKFFILWNCKSCGSLCLYADDSTFTLSNKDVEVLKEDINQKYQVIAQYMTKNKLILNSNKTHLLVMTSAKKHSTHQDFGIILDTGLETIYLKVRKNCFDME